MLYSLNQHIFVDALIMTDIDTDHTHKSSGPDYDMSLSLLGCESRLQTCLFLFHFKDTNTENAKQYQNEAVMYG